MKITLHKIENNNNNAENNSNNIKNNNSNVKNNNNTENIENNNNVNEIDKNKNDIINKEDFDKFVDSILNFNPLDFFSLIDYNKIKEKENNTNKNTDEKNNTKENNTKENTIQYHINSCGKIEKVKKENNTEKANVKVNTGFVDINNVVSKNNFVSVDNTDSVDNNNSVDKHYTFKGYDSINVNNLKADKFPDNVDVDVYSVSSFLNDISRIFYNIEDCNRIIQVWKDADKKELNRICGLRSCNNGLELTVDGINIATPDEIREKYAENTISTHLMDYSGNYFQMVCSYIEKLMYALWNCKLNTEDYNKKLHQ